MLRIHVIDSHTGGEPTRVIVAGGPPLGDGPLVDRVSRFREMYDPFRSAVVNEPRGSDAVVGALLCEPADPGCSAAVIFFNNVGYLGMCGHGTIGLVATLAYLNRIKPGAHRIETPVGIVTAELHESGEVTVANIPSYRLAADVEISVDGYGSVVGDIAWGGNWFFLTSANGIPLDMAHIDPLTHYAWAIRKALERHHLTGSGGEEIDHIELFSASSNGRPHGRNFVLCPGGSYDRSPCGTGTSAKLACLYAEGKLKEGQIWRQESIAGSVFEGFVRVRDGKVLPYIRGSAFVNADSELLLDERDPFCWGIPK